MIPERLVIDPEYIGIKFTWYLWAYGLDDFSWARALLSKPE